MAENKKVKKVNKDNAKKSQKIRENYYALTPFLIAENCVGIFRFYIKNGQLHPPNRAMKLYSTVLVTLYLIAFGFFLRLPTALSKQENLIDMIGEVPSFVILFHYTANTITTSFFLSKCNMDIINIIAELDDQLIKINDNNFYKKNRTKNIKFLIYLCLSQTLIFVIDIVTQFTEHELSPDAIIIFPVYLIQKLEILVFCLFIGMVKDRLSIINDYISKFLEEKDFIKTSVFTLCDRIVSLKDINMIGCPSNSNMKIRDLAMMYDKLGIICSLINNVYNFQIFMTLVSTFVFIVITIYTSLFYYKSPENHSGPLVNISIWCFTMVLVVAGMCYVCERLYLVRNSTKILVNQLIMDYDLPNTMRVQAKAFMEMIEAWPLRILIYDMFSVDITLMLKFISVATTYLIVIIQISHFSNNNN